MDVQAIQPRARQLLEGISTETTRYLCAAAHLDGRFRAHVISQNEDALEQHWAKVPSYGLDVDAVVAECYAAQARGIARFVRLAQLMAVTLLVLAVRFSLWPGILAVFATVAWVIVTRERWQARYATPVGHFSREAVGSIDRKGGPNHGSRTAKRHETMLRERRDNVVIYSGYSPFVGSGWRIGGWSFAVRTDKGKEDFRFVLDPSPLRSDEMREVATLATPIPFGVGELYRFVSDSLSALGIDGLMIDAGIHVDGRRIRDKGILLSHPLSRPVTRVSPAVVQRFIDGLDDDVRYYTCVRIVSWGGELVLSVFLRFINVGNGLFVEANYYLLPPLQPRYRKVDKLPPRPTWSKRLEVATESLFLMPLYCVAAPFVALGEACESIVTPILGEDRNQKAIERSIEENGDFDYGARTTLRERVSRDGVPKHFQWADKEMYLKLVERRTLDAIIEFLDAKCVDTSDLKERRTAILNSGVIMTGGSIEAQSLAVGQNAKSALAQATRVAKAATGVPQAGD